VQHIPSIQSIISPSHVQHFPSIQFLCSIQIRNVSRYLNVLAWMALVSPPWKALFNELPNRSCTVVSASSLVFSSARTLWCHICIRHLPELISFIKSFDCSVILKWAEIKSQNIHVKLKIYVCVMSHRLDVIFTYQITFSERK
jgi:hypothetical protein